MESAIERSGKFLTLLFAEVSYLRSQTKFRYLFHILRPNDLVEMWCVFLHHHAQMPCYAMFYTRT